MVYFHFINQNYSNPKLIFPRRWVIKHIGLLSGNLSDIVGQESELVKRIAEVYFQFIYGDLGYRMFI